MGLYPRPHYYALSHIIFGFAAAWYPIVGILALAYQLGQLALNIRVFPVEGKVLEGNSIKHTALKIGEIGLGYLIGLLVRKRN